MSRFTWKDRALEALSDLARETLLVTSDDLYQRVPEPPHYNMVGDVFREAVRLGVLIPTGNIVKSRRPSAKRRNIQLHRSGFLRFELNQDPVTAYLSQNPSPQEALFA